MDHDADDNNSQVLELQGIGIDLIIHLNISFPIRFNFLIISLYVP